MGMMMRMGKHMKAEKAKGTHAILRKKTLYDSLLDMLLKKDVGQSVNHATSNTPWMSG
jgi:hypothetical protein